MSAFSVAAFEAALRAALARRGIVEASMRVVAETGSTNDDAAAWARAGAPHGAIVIADQQRAGRGRLGRTWWSAPGHGLYLSVVLRPALAPALAPPLTLAVGLALLDTARAFGASAHLKWPNDLLVDEPAGRRKLAGVLTEMATSGVRIEHVVVGIGMNVSDSELPEALRAIATSLERATGCRPERADVAAELITALHLRCDAFVRDGSAATVRIWKAEVSFLGQRVSVTHGEDRLVGIAEDLDDEGALRLRDDEGRLHRLWAGDVVAL